MSKGVERVFLGLGFLGCSVILGFVVALFVWGETEEERYNYPKQDLNPLSLYPSCVETYTTACTFAGQPVAKR